MINHYRLLQHRRMTSIEIDLSPRNKGYFQKCWETQNLRCLRNQCCIHHPIFTVLHILKYLVPRILSCSKRPIFLNVHPSMLVSQTHHHEYSCISARVGYHCNKCTFNANAVKSNRALKLSKLLEIAETFHTGSFSWTQTCAFTWCEELRNRCMFELYVVSSQLNSSYIQETWLF